MSFGSTRNCPGCGERAAAEGAHRLGPWWVHARCHVDCTICGEEVKPPPVGKSTSVVAWRGAPVHAACKGEVQ